MMVVVVVVEEEEEEEDDDDDDDHDDDDDDDDKDDDIANSLELLRLSISVPSFNCLKLTPAISSWASFDMDCKHVQHV
jgi:ABC-type Zn2+ transport system substrate-binding protein/surface adhesin